MTVPNLSVIIPTKNRHGFLRAAVASVLEQHKLPVEILVVDDGQGAAEALAGVSPLVEVIDNGGRGPVSARALGVSLAKADLIAFLDDDDWFIDRGYFSGAAEMFSGGTGLVFCDGILKFEDGSQDEAFAFDADASMLEANNSILISGVIYRRSLHETLGWFDEALPYYWDWDWYLRVARSGAALRRWAKPAVAIRVHAENMSGAPREAARRENLDRFSAKHGLPFIPLKNHLSLAQEARRG